MNIFRKVIQTIIPKPPQWTPPNQEIMNSISEQMKAVLQKAYDNQYLNQLYKSVSTKLLLDESVKMYVGSNTCPKNQKVVSKLLEEARSKAQTEDQLQSVKYHQAVFQRLDAMKKNDGSLYDTASDKLLELANNGHAISNYLIGKQIYNTAIQQTNNYIKRRELMQNSVTFLNASLQKGCLEPFYLLGEMFRAGEITKPDDEAAYEYYVIAASYKNPFAYFQLAQYYKKGKVVQQNDKLYLLYLKKASEMGLPEAQHNLGIEYLTGKSTKKNEIKALGWFVHAAGAGFLPSKYNTAMMFLEGTSCNTLKPNIQYSLQILKQLDGKQGFNVSEIISKIQDKLKEQNNRSV